MIIREILQSLRPHQWVKNFFVFAGIIFSENLFHLDCWLNVSAAFGLFCLLSGSIYLINDILDYREDKIHPEKCHRPIAAGRLPIMTAIIAVVILGSIALTSAFLLSPAFGLIALIYFVMNLLYSKVLKHMVIIDVMTIGLGFVLRAMAGAVVIHVEISKWLILCTFLLALFLGFSKRRHELRLLAGEANNHRKILEEYDPAFLDMMITIVTSATIVAYALYTMSHETIVKFRTERLIYSTPFVMYGIFRYLYLVHLKNEGGSPSKTLVRDLPLIVNLCLWLLFICWTIYTKH
jgi:4-hydroxybenzoate polyprenyltransferase